MPSVQTGDISTYYEESGAGEPLILICGLSADLQAWRFQVPVLSKRNRVITYDNRGAGRTGAPDEPYSVAGMAVDLAGLLDHLQVDSSNIVGWSMGGLIAQSFALAHPRRVRKLVLVSTMLEPDGFVRLATRNWINVRRSDMPFEQVARFTSRWGYTPALYDNEALYEKLVQVMVSNPHAQKAHGFYRQADALLDFRAGEAAKAIAAKTLVLAGPYDNLIPPYLSERLAKAIPGAEYRMLSGAHASFGEFPDEFNRLVADFLG